MGTRGLLSKNAAGGRCRGQPRNYGPAHTRPRVATRPGSARHRIVAVTPVGGGRPVSASTVLSTYHASTSGNAWKRRPVIPAATSRPGVSAEPRAWDSDPGLGDADGRVGRRWSDRDERPHGDEREQLLLAPADHH